MNWKVILLLAAGIIALCAGHFMNVATLFGAGAGLVYWAGLESKR